MAVVFEMITESIEADSVNADLGKKENGLNKKQKGNETKNLIPRT